LHRAFATLGPNWSKIERGILAPPKEELTLTEWAEQLGLERGSSDWLRFFDYASVDAGRIPKYILEDEELVAKLPAFFRTLSGEKPEKLLKVIRRSHQP
jgi:hypothetical protein